MRLGLCLFLKMFFWSMGKVMVRVKLDLGVLEGTLPLIPIENIRNGYLIERGGSRRRQIKSLGRLCH